MIAPRFIVLRDETAIFSAYGASAQSFPTMRDAEIFAKLLASKFPQQRFVVCQVVAEFATESAHKVSRLRLVGA